MVNLLRECVTGIGPGLIQLCVVSRCSRRLISSAVHSFSCNVYATLHHRPAKDYFAHMVRLESSQDGKVGSSQLPKYFYQSCSVDILGGKHAMFEKTLSQQLHKPSSCAPFSTSALRDGQTKSHV